jgi:hypothetical protein
VLDACAPVLPGALGFGPVVPGAGVVASEVDAPPISSSVFPDEGLGASATGVSTLLFFHLLVLTSSALPLVPKAGMAFAIWVCTFCSNAPSLIAIVGIAPMLLGAADPVFRIPNGGNTAAFSVAVRCGCATLSDMVCLTTFLTSLFHMFLRTDILEEGLGVTSTS